VAQHVDAPTGDLTPSRSHGRQAGKAVPRLLEVVEADERDVVRHPNARAQEGAQRAEGEGVVQAEDGLR